MGAPGPPLGTWLPVLEPALEAVRLHPTARLLLETFARRIPATCLAALELRLAPGEHPVDFAARVNRPLEARACVDSVVGPAAALLARWADAPDIRRVLPELWLEFDSQRLTETGSWAPLPIARLALLAGRAGAVAPSPAAALSALLGAAPPARVGRQLADLLACAPTGLRPLYLFDLSPRGRGLRLELYTQDPALITGWLERIASPSAVAAVRESVHLLGDLDRYHVAVDLEDGGLGRPIGVEGSYRRPPAREPRWGKLLDRLRDAGLSSPARCEALLGWPGSDSFWTAPRRWPVDDGPPGGRCVRSLSHLKLTCCPGREPEAKAYLLFGWIRNQRGRSEGVL